MDAVHDCEVGQGVVGDQGGLERLQSAPKRCRLTARSPAVFAMPALSSPKIALSERIASPSRASLYDSSGVVLKSVAASARS
jgi:hypothetical protein